MPCTRCVSPRWTDPECRRGAGVPALHSRRAGQVDQSNPARLQRFRSARGFATIVQKSMGPQKYQKVAP